MTLLRPALVLVLALAAITGLAYPLAVTGLAQIALPDQADGSLIRDAAGQVVGSRLIGQAFSRDGYLHPRGSAAGQAGYDATASSGTNLGPMDPRLIARVAKDATALARSQAQESARGSDTVSIAPDAVEWSGSGLDPDVSPANAAAQAPRIAAARRLPLATVTEVIAAHTEGPALGFLGQPRVNVLAVNLALDALHPPGASPERRS
ncbi:MAG: potassium-transporting ATPase subunit KdpC [Alphaproteobacteria bacterium]|nr:potassium-transporting ATPase subunit KdpC [Alphaproteobacteria bacterium]